MCRMPWARHQSASSAQQAASQPGNKSAALSPSTGASPAGGHHSATIATRPPVPGDGPARPASGSGARQAPHWCRRAGKCPARPGPAARRAKAAGRGLRVRAVARAPAARRRWPARRHPRRGVPSAALCARGMWDRKRTSAGRGKQPGIVAWGLAGGHAEHAWTGTSPCGVRAGPHLGHCGNEKGVARDHPATPLYRIGCCYPTPGARLSSPRFRLQVTCENRICNVTNRCV